MTYSRVPWTKTFTDVNNNLQVKEKSLDLKVGYVDGDNLLHRAQELLSRIKAGEFTHLDKANAEVQLADQSTDFLDDPENMPVICMNAYLGYRAIKRGLDEGLDIVICGR
jgi:hypothetical protein